MGQDFGDPSTSQVRKPSTQSVMVVELGVRSLQPSVVRSKATSMWRHCTSSRKPSQVAQVSQGPWRGQPKPHTCEVKSCCCSCRPSRRSQERTVLSRPPVQSLVPSWEMSMQLAPSVWPWNCLAGREGGREAEPRLPMGQTVGTTLPGSLCEQEASRPGSWDRVATPPPPPSIAKLEPSSLVQSTIRAESCLLLGASRTRTAVSGAGHGDRVPVTPHSLT